MGNSRWLVRGQPIKAFLGQMVRAGGAAGGGGGARGGAC